MRRSVCAPARSEGTIPSAHPTNVGGSTWRLPPLSGVEVEVQHATVRSPGAAPRSQPYLLEQIPTQVDRGGTALLVIIKQRLYVPTVSSPQEGRARRTSRSIRSWGSNWRPRVTSRHRDRRSRAQALPAHG